LHRTKRYSLLLMLNNKIIKGDYPDAFRSIRFTGTLDEAITTIIDKVKDGDMWLYINGIVFKRSNNYSSSELHTIRTKLMKAKEPMFNIIRTLPGG
jgi:hypothetical protein